MDQKRMVTINEASPASSLYERNCDFLLKKKTVAQKKMSKGYVLNDQKRKSLQSINSSSIT